MPPSRLGGHPPQVVVLGVEQPRPALADADQPAVRQLAEDPDDPQRGDQVVHDDAPDGR